jgi:hypothetical protein
MEKNMRQLKEIEMLFVNGASILSDMKPSETPTTRPWNMQEKLKGVIVKPPILILPGRLPITIQ